eukprot:COSAG04_NODE_3194_length_3064_cov_2.095447_2_plen_313_part_00
MCHDMSWLCRGVGRFSVDERGSLALTAVLIQGAISVAAGASLSAQGSTFSNTLTVSGTMDADDSIFSNTLTVSGSMDAHDSTFSNTLTVSGTATLSGCTLAASATIDLSGGGSLSIASMAVPAAVLTAAENTLSGAGSALRLDAVTVPESPTPAAFMTGAMSVAADGSKSIDPKGAFTYGTPTFTVVSGPCAVSEGGRCVGRPEGYRENEDCAITVGGGGGLLGPCAVFDTDNVDAGGDYVTLPGGAAHYGSDCPEGAALAPGDTIAWYSNVVYQGSVGSSGEDHNGCAAKGTCGLPATGYGLGGGWELCFA